MQSDGINDDMSPDPQAVQERPMTTGGSMERARHRRLAFLAALTLLLLMLVYVAFYYSQNRRAPLPRFVTSTQAVDPPQFLYSFAGVGKQAMTKPTGIAIIRDRVYVTDFAYRTVRAYSADGDYLFDFSPISDGKVTRLDSPVHMAVGPDDTVWVTDRSLKGVYVFDEDGKFLRKFVPNGDESFSWSPLALTFGPNGNLYVTDVGDSTKHRVLVFGSDGRLITEWGATEQVSSVNQAPGNFLFPNGIAVSGTGAGALVYVADGNNRRVQVFRTDGRFVRIINTSGTPRGIAVDSQKRLYVVDALAQQVDLYSETGVPLVEFGASGGILGLKFPNDIAIDSRGRLFITDRENNQVQVWGPAIAEIPGVTRITPGNAWLPLLLIPLILIPLALWLRRRRRFVVTPDFVDGMIAADLVPAMAQGRWYWVMTEADQQAYGGRIEGDVALGELLHTEPYSTTDAGLIREQLSTTPELAGLLAMAKRYHVLCTEDREIARLAVRLGVDVYDRSTWLARFSKKK